jgi:hypothetical protein
MNQEDKYNAIDIELVRIQLLYPEFKNNSRKSEVVLLKTACFGYLYDLGLYAPAYLGRKLGIDYTTVIYRFEKHKELYKFYPQYKKFADEIIKTLHKSKLITMPVYHSNSNTKHKCSNVDDFFDQFGQEKINKFVTKIYEKIKIGEIEKEKINKLMLKYHELTNINTNIKTREKAKHYIDGFLDAFNLFNNDKDNTNGNTDGNA